MSVADTNTNAIRGWGCATDNTPEATETQSTKCLPKILTRGWRRNCLYGVLIFLMILVFLNIALTLWIVSTLNLSMNGIGPIKIVKGGIQVQGQTWVMDNLVASSILSQPAQPITMQSHRNFTVLVTDPKHPDRSKLLIKRDHVEFSGRKFHIKDARGDNVFHASKDEVRVYADTFAINGAGGVVTKSSLQVPLVRAPPGSDLQLESLTRGLDLRAPQSIYFESRAGSIDVTSHTNLKLSSLVGAIKIDAPNIVITNLKEAMASDKPQRGIRSMKVYQLCACATGKLFLAAPDVTCTAHSDDTELCR